MVNNPLAEATTHLQTGGLEDGEMMSYTAATQEELELAYFQLPVKSTTTGIISAVVGIL